MATIIGDNCTEIYGTFNKSCADTFLNKNETIGNVQVIHHMFPVSLMKSFVIAMNSVFLPIIVLVGLVGNTLTIYVFKKKKRKTSTILLLISLAVADLMCICMQIVYLLVQNRNHHFKYIMPKFVVNGFFMTRAIFYFDGISRWIKVVIVLERCVAVYFPFKVRIICTTKRTMAIVLSVFILVPLSSIPELMHIGVKGDRSSWSTYEMALQAIKENKPVFEWYGNLFQLVYGMTTLMINLVCNIAIGIGISKSSTSLSQITDYNDLRRTEKQRKITRMLLKLSIFYVATCLPKDVGAVILLTDTSGTIVFIGNYYFQSVLLFGLSASFMNNSVNFIFYGTSLSTFHQICCCRRKDINSIIGNPPPERTNPEKPSSSRISVNTCGTPLDTPNGSEACSPDIHANYI
ncbi:cysteinyl leukotriene receptor 1-like [Pecten maximus]|uniref:cysteinyl leukotriene receptor 1-like n=1 Tax=Pecten maximus TaxID=6579 RepID=UPI0014587EDF|nr:cysteinyl leukotriene receptor 1-like [Pecten maximus]